MEENLAKIIAAIAGVFVLLVLFAVFILVLSKAVLWKFYEKAGEPGWKCLIPYYDHIVSSNIATGRINLGIILIISTLLSSGMAREMMAEDSATIAYALAGLASTVTVIASFILNFNLAKSFGGSTLRCVLAVFFGVFALLRPAFSKNEKYNYIGSYRPHSSANSGSAGSGSNGV